MLALYLLAAHLVGDFVFQTRWQAERKIADWRVRLDHVVAYTIPMVVVGISVGHDWRGFYAFPAAVAVLHFATDSVRFYSTLGDEVAWILMGTEGRSEKRGLPKGYVEPSRAVLPPNPWPAVPIVIDQTLHVCQLALLGGLLLT